ncbi:MAG TPA: cation:dicarboxylase symporter family transporter, partial [Gemmatimonadaceae bacterium]|nr:cation:dicarboxylase symporter family transporter [Gemmatimonadaceae bacterium]
VASLGDARRLRRTGGRTLAWFVGTTTAGALIGLGAALAVGAGAGLDPAVRDAIAARFQASGASASAGVSSVPSFAQSVVAMVPVNPVAAAAQGDLLALIVAIVAFGAAANALGADARARLLQVAGAVNDAMLVLVGWTMQLAPPAIAILIAATVLRSGLDLLQALAAYAATVVGALVLHVAIVLLPLARFAAGTGVRRFARDSGDALLLALSTASSSVTLPVSLTAAARMGVPATVANFVLPAGTTLNKNGAAVYKAATAVFLAQLYGVPLGPAQLVTIVLTTIVASSAGAGVPGSSLVTTLIVLNAIGLGPNAAAGIALVAGIDRPLDMCRTAVNTASNLVGAAWVGRASAA